MEEVHPEAGPVKLSVWMEGHLLVTVSFSGVLVSIEVGSIWASSTFCSPVGAVVPPLVTPAQALMSSTEAMSHFLFGFMIWTKFTTASR